MKKKLKEAIRAIDKAIVALDALQENVRTKNYEGKIYDLEKIKSALLARLAN